MGGTSQGWATDGEQDSLCPHHTLVGRREPPMGWEHQRVWGEAIPMEVECLMARFPYHPLGPDGCLTPPLLTHMRRPWPCLDSPRLLDAEITQKKKGNSNKQAMPLVSIPFLVFVGPGGGASRTSEPRDQLLGYGAVGTEHSHKELQRLGSKWAGQGHCLHCG